MSITNQAYQYGVWAALTKLGEGDSCGSKPESKPKQTQAPVVYPTDKSGHPPQEKAAQVKTAVTRKWISDMIRGAKASPERMRQFTMGQHQRLPALRQSMDARMPGLPVPAGVSPSVARSGQVQDAMRAARSEQALGKAQHAQMVGALR